MINTGSSQPIVVKKILYSRRETVYCVNALLHSPRLDTYSRSRIGVGLSRDCLHPNPTRSTSRTSMILSDASVLTTHPSTVSLVSLPTQFHGVIWRSSSSSAWGGSSGCLMCLWDIISLPLHLQSR